MRFLFFMERELHVTILQQVMQAIHDQAMGEIGVCSVGYRESRFGMPGRGLRPETLQSCVDFPVTLVEDPYQWKPDITFLCDFSYQFVEGLGRIVNIGHGTISKGWFFSGKKISLRENSADLLCVPGEVHRDALREQVRIPIEVTGMPKLDPVFNGSWQQDELLREMGLDNQNRTLLFAPTFNPELSMIPHIGFDLDRIVPDYINVIIKLHGAAPEDWKQGFRDCARRSPNIYYTEDLDIGRCFIAADAMLSDVSSVIYEFLSLGKPVILFDSPTMRQYPNFDETDLEHRFRDVGQRVSDARGIRDALMKTFLSKSAPDRFRQIGERFVSVRDGSSAKRVVTAAVELLKEKPFRGSVILHGGDPQRQTACALRFANRYKIFATQPLDGFDTTAYTLIRQESSVFQTIAGAMEMISRGPVVVIDAGGRPSPLYADFMLNHLSAGGVGIVYPMRIASEGIDLQDLRLHVQFAQGVHPEQFGLHLTYSMTGGQKEIDYLDSTAFSFHRELFGEPSGYSDLADDKLCMLELLAGVRRGGLRPLLALDCLIEPLSRAPEHLVKQERPAAVKSEFQHPPEEGNHRPAVPEMTPQTPAEQSGQSGGFEQAGDGDNLSRVRELIEQSIRPGARDEKVVQEPAISREEPDDRVERLKDKISQDPSDPELIKSLIQAYFERGEYEMVDVYEAMIPFDAEVTLLSSIALSKQKLSGQALEKIESIDTLAISDKSLLCRVLIQKSKLYMRSGRYDEALSLADEALQIDSRAVDALITKGTYYLVQNDLQSAAPFIEEAYRLDPDNLNALYGTGLLLSSKGDIPGARERFLRALQLDPMNVNAMDGLLTCAYQTRDFDHIQKYVENYTRENPHDFRLLFVLAGIYYEQELYEKALAAIDRVIAMDHDLDGTRELRDKILNHIY